MGTDFRIFQIKSHNQQESGSEEGGKLLLTPVCMDLPTHFQLTLETGVAQDMQQALLSQLKEETLFSLSSTSTPLL